MDDKLLSESSVKLTGYGGANIPASGEIDLDCKLNNHSVSSKFIVVPINVKPVLDLHTSYKLGLVLFGRLNLLRSTQPNDRETVIEG